jgi:hypothetical protein
MPSTYEHGHDEKKRGKVKLSPWRFSRRTKKSPVAKTPSPSPSPTPSPSPETRSSKGNFLTPIRKFRQKKGTRKHKKEENDVIMVTVLPKSPFRGENGLGGDAAVGEQAIVIRSPPRILRPSKRSLETEQKFSQMLEAYILKYHNHHPTPAKSVTHEVRATEHTHEDLFCEEATRSSIPTRIGSPSAEQTSETSRSEDYEDDLERKTLGVYNGNCATLYKKDSTTASISEISELTIPMDIQPLMEQVPAVILRRISKYTSEVAGNFLNCGDFSAMRSIKEDYYSVEGNEDGWECEGEDEGEDEYDSDEESSEWSTSSSEVDIEFLIPEITLRNCSNCQL